MAIKNSGILVYYSVLIFAIAQQQQPSVFLVFFSLVAELLVLIWIYIILGYKINTFRSIGKANNVLVGSILFIFIHYVFAVVLGAVFQEFGNIEQFQLYDPLRLMWKAIALIFVSLIVTYGMELRMLWNTQNLFETVEVTLIKQGLRVWITGIVGVLLIVIFMAEDKELFLTILIILRLLVELYEIVLRKGWIKKYITKNGEGV